MKFNYNIIGDIKKEKENAKLPTRDIHKRSIAIDDDGEIIIMDTCGNYTYASDLTAEKIYPLTKDQFVRVINDIKENEEKINRINDVLRENCEDAVYCPPSLHHTLLDLLQELFNDELTDWIGYFIYDLDFGQKWEPGMVTDNGKDIPLKTAEDLYDLLIKNLEKE